MTPKKIIPKDVNYNHMIKDKSVRDVVSSSNDAKFTIDKMTRKYLRGKYPNRLIEGQERIEGRVIKFGIIMIKY